MDDNDNKSTGSDEAANLARAKLESLYGRPAQPASDDQMQQQGTPAPTQPPIQAGPVNNAPSPPPNHQSAPQQPTFDNAPQARSPQQTGTSNAFHLPRHPNLQNQSPPSQEPHQATEPQPHQPQTHQTPQPSQNVRGNDFALPGQSQTRHVEPPQPSHQAPTITELYEREQNLQQDSEPLKRTPSLPDHQLSQGSNEHSLPSGANANAFMLPGEPNIATTTAPQTATTQPTTITSAPQQTNPQMSREEQIAQHVDAQKPPSDPNSFWSKARMRWDHFMKGDDITPGHGKALVRALTVSALLVVFYNHQIIFGQVQYYISPGDQVVSPAIIDPSDSQNVGEEPRIVIPKINVDVPVVYDITSWADADVQKGLERGVVHYGTTALPGEIGNNVIVGHSSNSVWTAGKYKFAFVLLDQLDDGDTFILDYKGERYIYEVFKKKVIEPTDVEVLSQDFDEPVTTLITCTPPGTAWRRLIVQARQISPNPNQAELPQEREINENQAIPGDTKSFVDTLRDIFN